MGAVGRLRKVEERFQTVRTSVRECKQGQRCAEIVYASAERLRDDYNSAEKAQKSAEGPPSLL